MFPAFISGSAPFGKVAQKRMFAALDVDVDEVRRRVEGGKNESPIAGSPVVAPELPTLAQEEIRLQMVPINEKDVRLILNVEMPFVDAFRVYNAIQESMQT